MNADHLDNGEPHEDASTSPSFAHLFPWPEFLDRMLAPSCFKLLRPDKEHPTLRDMKPIWCSAEDVRKMAPPGEIVIPPEEDLKLRVVGEIRDYMSTNYEGFVEHDIVKDGAFPKALLRALHFAWMDHDPSLPVPPPTVQQIADLTRRFTSSLLKNSRAV